MNKLIVLLIIIFLVIFYVYTFIKLKKKKNINDGSQELIIKNDKDNYNAELVNFDYIEREKFNKLIQDEIHPENKNKPETKKINFKF